MTGEGRSATSDSKCGATLDETSQVVVD